MTDPTRYTLGVKAYARGQARAQNLGLNLSLDDPEERVAKAHEYGMGYASGISRHRSAGPPLVSEDEFSSALHGTFDEEVSQHTPERAQQMVSYMSAQAADEWGAHNREMKAHRDRYG